MPDMQTPPTRSGADIFELVCPHCGRDTDVVVLRNHLPPRLYCDDCIRRHSEIVELKIVRVSVGAGNPSRA